MSDGEFHRGLMFILLLGVAFFGGIALFAELGGTLAY